MTRTGTALLDQLNRVLVLLLLLLPLMLFPPSIPLIALLPRPLCPLPSNSNSTDTEQGPSIYTSNSSYTSTATRIMEMLSNWWLCQEKELPISHNRVTFNTDPREKEHIVKQWKHLKSLTYLLIDPTCSLPKVLSQYWYPWRWWTWHGLLAFPLLPAYAREKDPSYPTP